jgi:iron complex transport system substrate-binding protein
VIFNQRSVDEILSMILTLSAMVGAADKGRTLIDEIENGLESIKLAAKKFPRRPRVYFEEWDEPMISAIRWVSELIGIAGGEDVFDELSRSHAAAGRTIADPSAVVGRSPDVIIGSWCGKKFRPERVAARPGWDAIPAVRAGALYEIKSADILQPGPAALTDGVRRMHQILTARAADLSR